ncbi:MAG: chorismate mutase [Erysipelotrichaceae bacterium]|nr:chorismate mutase [Erysipelotrichaceae bacterium]
MDKLLQCRQKIDEIDTKIIELFEARMDVIKDVVAYKLANNMPVLDASREVAMLEKI